MKTKEAIEFLKGIKHSGNGYGNSYISDFNGLKGIISLLEQVEKYENIWEELYGIASEFNFFPLMDKLEQKYFPEGNVDKVVEGITEQIKEGVEIARKEAKK